MGGKGFLPRASEKLLAIYSCGMYLVIDAISSTTWPSPSIIFCSVLMISPCDGFSSMPCFILKRGRRSRRQIRGGCSFDEIPLCVRRVAIVIQREAKKSYSFYVAEMQESLTPFAMTNYSD